MKHKDRAIRTKPRGQKETTPEKGAPADQFTIVLSEDQIKLLDLFSTVDNVSREDWIARVVGRCLVDRASGYR